jgi:Tfp pilus assembly protein PilF/ADP-heptose:LPS heptosyltransferase
LLSEVRQAFSNGRFDDAQLACLVGLSRFPAAAPLLAVLGWVQAQRGDFANAELSFRHALSHDPRSVDANSGTGAVLAAKGEFVEAEEYYRRALDLMPNDGHTLFNYGCTLLALRRFEAAIGAFENALAFDPRSADTFHNLAIAYAQLGRWDAAIKCSNCVLAHDRNSWQARMLRGASRIAVGEFAEGWDDYEARCEPRQGEIAALGLPAWRGPGDQRRSIVVIPEQGIGTQVLFASCVEQLADHVPQVTVGCEPRLVGILRRSLPKAHVVPAGLLRELARECLADCYAWAGSLPRFFRRSAADFPGDAYLQADSAATLRWRTRLDELGDGLKIGVSWGGGGQATDTLHRRTPPEAWQNLSEVAGTQWINLQCDAPLEDVACWQRMAGERFHDWNDFDKKHDLENFTALVSKLDLVVTVVNSTAHIAGALGVPTWTLVPLGGEWRWQASGTSCMWHRSVRLFRQQCLDDWSSVFDELRAELTQRVESSHLRRSDLAA